MSRSSGGTSSTPTPRSARPDLMAASMYAWSQLISLIGGSGLRSALSERVRMSWMRSPRRPLNNRRASLECADNAPKLLSSTPERPQTHPPPRRPRPQHRRRPP